MQNQNVFLRNFMILCVFYYVRDEIKLYSRILIFLTLETGIPLVYVRVKLVEMAQSVEAPM